MEPRITLSSQTKRCRPPIVSGEQPICGVCKVQFSRYTCPSCNLHYCSLPCFRSEGHSTCSETFDRKTLLDDIQAAKDKTGEEKRAMIDMLKKFEEESLKLDEEALSGGGEGEEEEDSERMELENRLEGLDLDSLEPDDLLALLSPAQRDAFDVAMRDPAKASALVSAEFQGDDPWWQTGEHEEDEEDEENESAERVALLEEDRLPLLRVGGDGRALVSPQLLYNIIAVIFAYVYTLRTFSLSSFSALRAGSTERVTAIEVLAQLLPFLMEKSTVLLDDVGGAVEYVVSRETPDTISPKLLAILLRDVHTILLPAVVSPLSTSPSRLDSHPFRQVLTAISDLHQLLSSSPVSLPPPSIIKRPSTTRPLRDTTGGAQKLLFYAAFLASTSSPITSDFLRGVAGVILAEAERRDVEDRTSTERIQLRKEERSGATPLKAQETPVIEDIV